MSTDQEVATGRAAHSLTSHSGAFFLVVLRQTDMECSPAVRLGILAEAQSAAAALARRGLRKRVQVWISAELVLG